MRKPTRSGEFDQRVTILDKETTYSFSSTFASNSQKGYDYSVIESGVWCSVKYIGTPSAGASEDNINDQRTGKSKIEVEMRYRNDVSHEDIIVYMGGWFEIYSIQEGGRDETTIIRAELRDDDTFTLSVADGYTEEFYEENPLGYSEEDTSSNAISPIARIDQWEYISNKVLRFRMNEVAGWAASESDFHMALPVDWFNNRTKSGVNGDPGYDDTAKMLISILDEDLIDPTQCVLWTSQPPSIPGLDVGCIKVTDGSFEGANEFYPMVQIDVEMTLGKTAISPSLYTTTKVSNTQFSFPSSIFTTDIEKRDLSRAYTRTYSIKAYDTAGVAFTNMNDDVLKSGDRFIPGISLIPFIFDSSGQDNYLDGFNPHYFGGSRANLTIRGVIKRLVAPAFGSDATPQISNFSWTQNDIEVSLDGAMPFVDLSPANLVRSKDMTVKTFQFDEDGVYDYESNGNSIAKSTHSDYWRVIVENGTTEGTTKLTIELRYDKFGMPTMLTDLVTGEVVGDLMYIYPLNIYHKSLYGAVSLSDTFGYFNHYSNDSRFDIHASCTAPYLPEKRIYYDNATPNAYGYQSQNANIALEDMTISLKNFKVVVKRTVFPDEWEFGDDVTYEYEEIDLYPYWVENTESADFLYQNNMGHKYVFDNIEHMISDDDINMFNIHFDVVYDIDKLADDEIMLFRTNDGDYSQYQYDEETGQYTPIDINENPIPLFDEDEGLEEMNNFYRQYFVQAGRKHLIFPYTTHFNLRQRNNLM